MKIGTRGSALALWQARHVSRLLTESGATDVQIVELRTSGDREAHRPLGEIAGLGAFTKEIEEALLRHDVDLAVHSLKDLPTQLHAGLVLAGVPGREDVRDALVASGGLRLDQLPSGARVATSSQRRAAQILAMRPDVRCVEIRGNVPTRVRKVQEGEIDAAILALAGLRRLELDEFATQIFEPHEILPAVGQGALGLETRTGEVALRERLAAISDPDTFAAVLAERELLRHLGGGCRMPLGAWARVVDGTFRLTGCACSLDGTRVLRAESTGRVEDAEALGREVAQALEAQGARALLEAAGDVSNPQ